MSKRSQILWLSLFLSESLLVSGDLVSRWLFNQGLFQNGFSAIDIPLFFLFSGLSIGLFTFILSKFIRSKYLDFIERVFNESEKNLLALVIILALLIYETFQDFLFLQSDIAAAHYQGYQQILENYYSIVIWLFLVSFQLLLIILICKKDLVSSWLRERSRQKWFYILIFVVGLVFFFNEAAFGYIPAQFESRYFEELNSPLIGLQVLLVLCFVTIGLAVLTYLEGKTAWISNLLSDKTIFIILLVAAFLTWFGEPLESTTFTDIPRPPNFEVYPKSDALGFQKSAYELLNGSGTGVRSNHIVFWHHLAAIDLITGDDVFVEYIIRLIIISFIPAVLYLLTKSLSNRLAGLLVGILFIIRELNSIIILEYVDFPQLRDGLTEPLTILGISLSMALLFIGLKGGRRYTILYLLAGGLFGWIVLLRIETIVYAAAIGLGLTLLLWKSRQEWLRTIMVFAIGAILVAGPWFYTTVKTTGSLLSIGLGKTHLIRNSYEDFSSGEESNQESDNYNKRDMFPNNLGNNIISLLYYLPSNHQPLLTIKNLPDLFLDRIDYSDLEENTFKEKYFERYVRSLPYWWNDWDGQLPERAILPISLSLLLIFYGFIQVQGKNKILAVILIMIATSHILVYSFVGKSGGRFIQVVDWISLVFYGIGISGILAVFRKQSPERDNNWWYGQQEGMDLDQNRQEGISVGLVLIAICLLIYGISIPLTETKLPPKYSGEMMAQELSKLESVAEDDLPLTEILNTGIHDLEIVYGKALYPRFLEAGSGITDSPKGRYTDYTIDRVEFYLVGTENIWAALPGSQTNIEFPHGSEVIILGTRTLRVNYIPAVDEVLPNPGEYLKISRIYLLDQLLRDGQPVWIDCTGVACVIPWSDQ